MREKIEAIFVYEEGQNMCYESEARELEERLREAVEKIKHIRDFSMASTAVRPSMIFDMCNNFLTTLDQEKEKSDD